MVDADDGHFLNNNELDRIVVNTLYCFQEGKDLHSMIYGIFPFWEIQFDKDNWKDNPFCICYHLYNCILFFSEKGMFVCRRHQ